jgi:hypothetical protein
VLVSDDGVRDPKTENNVLDKICSLLASNLSHEPCLNPLGELVNCNKQVGQATRVFSCRAPKGPDLIRQMAM